MRFATRDNARAFIQSIGDVFLHFGYRFLVDQRPGGDVRLQTIAEVQFAHCLLEFFGKTVATPSCTYRRLAQTQVWPALRNFDASAPSTALSRSASSKTINGALPPSSSDTFDVFGALLH